MRFNYFKTEVDSIDIDKLKAVPADLGKLSHMVNNDVVKKLYMINYKHRQNI